MPGFVLMCGVTMQSFAGQNPLASMVAV
jgi:hypothetical protein